MTVANAAGDVAVALVPLVVADTGGPRQGDAAN